MFSPRLYVAQKFSD